VKPEKIKERRYLIDKRSSGIKKSLFIIGGLD
jgi:hypothetical protein